MSRIGHVERGSLRPKEGFLFLLSWKARKPRRCRQKGKEGPRPEVQEKDGVGTGRGMAQEERKYRRLGKKESGPLMRKGKT